MPALDIILPCYNPLPDWAERVVSSMEKLQKALPEVDLHLIIVNDGSSQGVELDQVDQIRKAVPNFQYLSYPQNRGKGYALRKGVEAAKNELQIFTDIDFPYEEDSLIQLYERLAAGEADVVAGVRDQEYYKGVPENRKRISRFLRWMLKVFLSLEITDTQCGLKGFNATGRPLFLETRIKRFLFDMEFIFLASNARGVRLEGHEVRLKPGIVFSKVRWGILMQEGFNFMWVFLRGVRRKVFGG